MTDADLSRKSNMPKRDLSHKSSTTQRDILPVVCTYSSWATRATRILKDNFVAIPSNTHLGRSLRVVSAFHRNPNLKDLLVRAKLSKPRTTAPPHSRTLTVRNRTTKEVFRRQRIPKSQSNCVYLLSCRKCGLQYVGETGNTLSTRLSSHLYNIKTNHKKDTSLVKHFQNHGILNVRWTHLESNPEWTTRQRRNHEHWWIQHLGTLEPAGLNSKGR